MNVKQAYFDFLKEQGAKEKVQTIIRKGIDKWKQHPAYEFHPDDNDHGDFSGHCWNIHNKTIGDIAKTDVEVLKAYTGDNEATYTSGCGLHWLRVGDRIGWDISDRLCEFRGMFIQQNADILFNEYDIIRENDWTDDDIFLTLDEAITLNDHGLNINWMMKEFPEYIIDDDDMPSTDYLFCINE